MLIRGRNNPIERCSISAPHARSTPTITSKCIHFSALAAAAVCLSAGILGCGLTTKPCKGADCGGGGTPPPKYPPRTTPRRAVEYLRAAWENRDSTRADTVYTADYQGTSTDQSDPIPSTLSFAKSDEVRAIGGLQLDPVITTVSLDFHDSTTWITESFPGDPPDWVVVTVPNKPTILVTKSNAADLKVTGTDRFEFKTQPVTAGGQTLWQIVRWTEVHNTP